MAQVDGVNPSVETNWNWHTRRSLDFPTLNCLLSRCEVTLHFSDYGVLLGGKECPLADTYRDLRDHRSAHMVLLNWQSLPLPAIAYPADETC